MIHWKRGISTIFGHLAFLTIAGTALAFTRTPRTDSRMFLPRRMAASLAPSAGGSNRSLLFPVSGYTHSKAPISRTTVLLAIDSAASPSEDGGGTEGETEDNIASNQEKKKKKSLAQSIKSYFSPPDDGLTFRQRLAKMGMAAVLSYGWVSNMSYSITVSLAWYIFSKRTGLSPLAPGQWKGFLAIYAGFYIFNNIVRPIRVALAVAISPKFDDAVKSIQNRFGVNKAAAVTITVIIANFFGTLAAMSAGIFLASVCAGVPIWAK